MKNTSLKINLREVVSDNFNQFLAVAVNDEYV